MKKLGFEDIVSIYRVCKNDLSHPICFDDITSDDYHNYVEAIKNLKLIIKNEFDDARVEDYFDDVYEIYRYCDYLFGKPEFIKIIEPLNEEEKRVLIAFLSKMSSFDISIDYVAKLLKIERDEVIEIIRNSLQKVYEYLKQDNYDESLNKENIDIVLKLTKKETN